MFIVCLPCPSLLISHFSKEPWFLWLENGIRNQDLGAGCSCCYRSVIVSGPFSGDRRPPVLSCFSKWRNMLNASSCRYILRQVAGLLHGINYSPDPSFTWSSDRAQVKLRWRVTGHQRRNRRDYRCIPPFISDNSDLSICHVLKVSIELSGWHGSHNMHGRGSHLLLCSVVCVGWDLPFPSMFGGIPV